jgi:2-polyprenyl-3-methyl-5-hydroxy-6-metoxy-1,4-benzoquinol methylase
MTVATISVCEWADYISDDFAFDDYPPGARVLDVGFGAGEQMRRLEARGCRSIGVEPDPGLARDGRLSGLAVCRAFAERLPFLSGAFDGVICKVVIPYTDEAAAIAELARIVRSGAIARVSYHGLGYTLRDLLTDRNWRRRVYGARVIVNTWLYSLTHKRLPGFWGDTLYQSERRLRKYYERAGFHLVNASPSPRFLGAPVFIYHTLRRR